MLNFSLIILLLFLHTPLLAQSPEPSFLEDEAQNTGAINAGITTGQVILTFKEPNPQSDFRALSRRFKFTIATGTPLYVTAAQIYHVYIPSHYDGTEPFGLIVYVSPSDRPMIPRRDWTDVFDRHNLIFICAQNTGNKQNVLHRFAAALDAVHHMPLQYNINSNRVYASGMSGGGRCASMLGLVYPDLFNGAMPFCGVNYYRNIPVPDQPGNMWRATFSPPAVSLIGKSRLHSRFALLTGSEDFNQKETQAVHEIMIKHRFKNVHYLEVPGMKHTAPNGVWLEKALVKLDSPLSTSIGPKSTTAPIRKP